MSAQADQIEEIVRAVFVRLTANEHEQSGMTPVKELTIDHEAKNPNKNGTWTWSQRVLGIRELAALPRESTSVLVRRGAVITPAARDWLRDRKIDIGWEVGTKEQDPNTVDGNPATQPANSSRQSAINSKLRLALGCTYDTRGVEQLLARLQQRQITVQQVARTGLATVVNEVADLTAKSGYRGLVLTDNGWAATVEANRTPGVRAAWCREPRDGAAAKRAIGPNLLIVEPRGWTAWGLAELVLGYAEGF